MWIQQKQQTIQYFHTSLDEQVILPFLMEDWYKRPLYFMFKTITPGTFSQNNNDSVFVIGSQEPQGLEEL